MNSEISIRKIESKEFPAAEKFYQSINYAGGIQPSDIVFAAYNKGSEIVGVARLATEFGHLVLRGMMISPKFQRQGIGSKMLRDMRESIGSNECYCIPRTRLETFYGQIGFSRISDDRIPQHLLSRLNGYRKKYPDLFAMKRPVF